MIGEPPSTEGVADRLGVDADTLRRCLRHAPKLTLAHLIAYADLDPNDPDRDTERELEAWFRGYAWHELVDDRSRSGYLIDCGRPEHNNERLKLLRCPVCGASYILLWSEGLSDPLARHLAAEHDAEDFRQRPVASDVFYTRRASATSNDREGTQQHNRLRKEPHSRGPLHRVRPAGNRRPRELPYQVLCEAPTKSLRSPSSGASTLSGATSSRRRASDTLE